LSRIKTKYLKCPFSKREGGIVDEVIIRGVALARVKNLRYLGLVI